MKVLGVLRLKDGREWQWEEVNGFRKYDTSKEQLPSDVVIDLVMGTCESGYEILLDDVIS